MSTIKFMPNETGALINVSKRNPEFGWVRIASEEVVLDSVTGFPKTSKKSFLIKEKISNLTAFLALYPNGVMPGKLVNIEFVESNAPAEFNKLLNKKVDYETAIAPFVKRAGSGGPELTLGGERILKYTKYSPSMDAYDVLVAHDNAEAVAEYNASRNANGANLG